MARTETFRYLQVQHALQAAIPKGQTLSVASPLEDRILEEYMPKKAISMTYQKLVNNMPDPLLQLRQHWERDITGLEDEDWQEALASPKEVAITSRLRLVQLKVLHRTYLSSTALVKVGYRADPGCGRECGLEGTFVHILWECVHI